MSIKHTFAICAYKESAYLEECIKSLAKQSVKSKIIMVTSTPNLFIKNISKKYSIPLYINEKQGGIVQDWNFAYACADSKYVTIAHQDDIYFSEYARSVIMMADKATEPLIVFTNYAELRNGKKVNSNKLLRIKRCMLFLLRFNIFWRSRFVRRRILSFGSPICCPSVTFVKDNLPNEIFSVGFRADEDWEAWEKLSILEGSFIYSPQILMAHRIHAESETTLILQDSARGEEDFIMFCKFWPKWVAIILTRLYGVSEKSNNIK